MKALGPNKNWFLYALIGGMRRLQVTVQATARFYPKISEPVVKQSNPALNTGETCYWSSISKLSHAHRFSSVLRNEDTNADREQRVHG
jgi:hypothetical protein